MTGVIMMIFGVLTFVAGFVIYKVSAIPTPTNAKSQAFLDKDMIGKSGENNVINSQGEEFANQNEELTNNSVVEVFESSSNKEEALNNAIEIAISDGVLTPNEKKIIRRIAQESNLDSESAVKSAENKLKKSKQESETEFIDINKKNGDNFEKFIVQKFNQKYFSIKEWAGDKYVKGIYAKTTQQPDLLIEFSLGKEVHVFSVECKWRKNLYKGGIEFSKIDQLERYRAFEKNSSIPVFIAVGVGGESNAPEKLYIIPLRKVDSNFINEDQLLQFEKNIEKGMFYDYKEGILK
jgi:hypothetical protein